MTKPSYEERRTFPIQRGTPIPLALAEVAYRTYAAHYSGQSLERLAERGGFGWHEFLHLYFGDADWKLTDAQVEERWKADKEQQLTIELARVRGLLQRLIVENPICHWCWECETGDGAGRPFVHTSDCELGKFLSQANGDSLATREVVSDGLATMVAGVASEAAITSTNNSVPKCANCHFEIKPGTRHGKIEPLSCVVTQQTIFRPSSSLASQGAESADIGKLDTVDDAVSILRKRTTPERLAEARDDLAEEKRIRDEALEEAALIADYHWPESGHVPKSEAVSCAMSISIDIRRRKSGVEMGKINRVEEKEKL